MPILDAQQQRRAVEVMKQYLAGAGEGAGKSAVAEGKELDRDRETLIAEELKPLLDSYLSGKTALSDFKSKNDGINKRNQYWGFKGIKGQMFFNMLLNTAVDLPDCDRELKAVLALPADEHVAMTQLRNFICYVKSIGEEHLEKGGGKSGRPKIGSVPFFVSYFWQIQNWRLWPVYYTNGVQVMNDLNLWQPTGDFADDYVLFKHIQEELVALFTKASGEPFDLYGVEHVLWFKGGNPYGGTKDDSSDDTEPPVTKVEPTKLAVTLILPDGKLPESYVPPIVAALPLMAAHDAKMREAAEASGTSLERAFEKSINAAFTIMGFETQLLGHGKGRVPDGRAVHVDSSYALLWDAKVRTDGYSMGTDDRTIREYITTQSRELKRRSLRNIYYVIVSSRFPDDGEDLIRNLKMETEINEVVLLEAEALVAMVDLKLRDPHQVALGADGIQRLFTSSGILTAAIVREILG